MPVAAVDTAGIRTLVNVPMLKENELIGVVSIYRQQVRPFTDRQIELVTNFASQAVIAIENVRLLNELRQRADDLSEALEQQTATSDVLRVISSSPGELEPVFETILKNAVRICVAKFGAMYFYERDAFRFVAMHNAPPAWAENRRREPVFRPHPDSGLGRVALTKRVAHIADIRTVQAYVERAPHVVASAELAGYRTLLAVPMLTQNELVGAVLIYRQEVRPFTGRQIELVTNFASQAVIAIENVRLLNELRQRTDELLRSIEELRGLGEISQTINSTLDLPTVLTAIVGKAVELSGTDAGAIYVTDAAGETLDLGATYGMSQEVLDALAKLGVGPLKIEHGTFSARHPIPGSHIIAEAARRREPVQISDLRDEPHSPIYDVIIEAGYRAVLAIPMISPDRVVGALVVRRKTPGEFPKPTVDLMQTFAAQSALATQNADLFHQIEEKSRLLSEASQHKSQFLANMSHELRTPLNAVLGYTELILDSVYGNPPEKMRDVLKRIESNGEHLLGLINDVLDLSKIEAGQLTLSLSNYSLNDVIQTVFGAVEPLAAGKQIALKIDVAPELPPGRGDEQRLTQVLLNLVGNAIKFTDAGEVSIRGSSADGSFHVAVRDTGPGISTADQRKLFQEFQQADNSITRKKGGTGLGLAISRQIIEMHGGRIWVESSPGCGSTFSFMLPVTVEPQARPA